MTRPSWWLRTTESGSMPQPVPASTSAWSACASEWKGSEARSRSGCVRVEGSGSARLSLYRRKPMPDIRILLAEDQTLLRQGLRTILELEPGLTVVGEAADGEEAVR